MKMCWIWFLKTCWQKIELHETYNRVNSWVEGREGRGMEVWEGDSPTQRGTPTTLCTRPSSQEVGPTQWAEKGAAKSTSVLAVWCSMTEKYLSMLLDQPMEEEVEAASGSKPTWLKVWVFSVKVCGSIGCQSVWFAGRNLVFQVSWFNLYVSLCSIN